MTKDLEAALDRLNEAQRVADAYAHQVKIRKLAWKAAADGAFPNAPAAYNDYAAARRQWLAALETLTRAADRVDLETERAGYVRKTA